jgi:aspartyl-tRNA(Asn)/glutamyl-tRNA(Gln) amidotransferase subunit A
MSDLHLLSAQALAARVRAGKVSAVDVVKATLARIATENVRLNAFTDVTADRALAKAAELDVTRAAGGTLPPLAGVPFAVKNLFDVKGLPTRAGSKINRDRAPAKADSPLIERLEAAGAVLVGALNMGEYAYDFTGENVHDGASLNPHDLGRMTGGSSGGSGAAVAGGLVPLALGSDTNGSIRVPSSFCGLYGLKPTYGRLSRARSFPFVASFDHLGPFARSVGDLALTYDAMQGPDADDPHLRARPIEPTAPELEEGVGGLRVAVLGGHFRRNGEPAAFAAVDLVAAALSARGQVELPSATLARAAAYVITAAEGAALHLDRLRARAGDFDPDTRDRFFAGATVPAVWVQKAQRIRALFREEARALFEHADILLAPATPVMAPLSGAKTLTLDGEAVMLRPNIGVYTQPISFIGLPVVAVPVWFEGSALPIGVQVIAPPWREELALRVARQLERDGVTAAPVARGFQ